MADRLRARRNLHYPTGKSLEVILAAGGKHQMSKAEYNALEFKKVEAGSLCDFLRDDLPSSSLGALLRDGKVELVAEKKKAKPKKKGGK